MKCPECPKEIVRVEDGDYYHREDTEWGIEPTKEDPGILVPKKCARPAVCIHNEET